MKTSRARRGSTPPPATVPLVPPVVATDGANLKALFRVLYGKSNWAAGAARGLGCSKRHIYRLTAGQRRLTPRALAIIQAVAPNRLRRRREEIADDLALAESRAAEERDQFPWVPRYIAELGERAARRQADAAAAKLAKQQLRQAAAQPGPAQPAQLLGEG